MAHGGRLSSGRHPPVPLPPRLRQWPAHPTRDGGGSKSPARRRAGRRSGQAGEGHRPALADGAAGVARPAPRERRLFTPRACEQVQLHEHFSHREHVCLVFEALGVNLLQLLQQNGCRGLSLSLVRFFSKQLLQALILLRQLGVIHCDLKPDTLLLRRLRSPAIRQSTLEPLVFIGEHPAAEPAVARHQDHRLRLRLLRAADAHLLLHPVALLPLARGAARLPVLDVDRHVRDTLRDTWAHFRVLCPLSPHAPCPPRHAASTFAARPGRSPRTLAR